MNTIDKFEDDVLIAFLAFTGVIVIIVLWLTTRVRNDHVQGAVFVVERYRQNLRWHRSRNLTRRARELLTAEAESTENMVTENENSNENVTPEESTTSETVVKNNETEVEATGTDIVGGDIKVRLKYLNDSIRVVDARLDETVENFKRCNFTEELSLGKTIRLIFNGRILTLEQNTLGQYRLFDNCVVHTLILPKKQPRTPEVNEGTPATNNEQPPPVREWNLGRLLVIMLLIFLGISWYCRLHFSALFTFSSTAMLIGLTIMFLFSSLGPYIMDQ